MKYFGTDGIRLQNMEMLEVLTIKGAYALKMLNAKQVVVGYDQRPYGKQLYKTLIKSFSCLGVDVFCAGVVPSACVSYLNTVYKTDFAVMLTASHNPSNINGIKIFNANGEKLTVAQEKKIERLFDELPQNHTFEKLEQVARHTKIKKGKVKKLSINLYMQLLKQHSPNLKDKTIVLDCANGASKYLAKKVFAQTQANIILLNNKNGRHINDNCGAVYPNQLANEVVKNKANIGFAFDGDADRCVCVLSDGRVISGDNALLGIAKHYKYPQIVGTIYSNGAIDEVLRKDNITFHRSGVGDQAVKKLMNKTKCKFGGERSGHFIFSDLMPTGDGMLSALKIAAIDNFETLCLFDKTPSKTINFATKNKSKDLIALTSMEGKYMPMLGDHGRIIIRPSGTENLIRVLIEHKDLNVVNKIEEMLKKKIEHA